MHQYPSTPVPKTLLLTVLLLLLLLLLLLAAAPTYSSARPTIVCCRYVLCTSTATKSSTCINSMVGRVSYQVPIMLYYCCMPHHVYYCYCYCCAASGIAKHSYCLFIESVLYLFSLKLYIFYIHPLATVYDT